MGSDFLGKGKYIDHVCYVITEKSTLDVSPKSKPERPIQTKGTNPSQHADKQNNRQAALPNQTEKGTRRRRCLCLTNSGCQQQAGSPFPPQSPVGAPTTCSTECRTECQARGWEVPGARLGSARRSSTPAAPREIAFRSGIRAETAPSGSRRTGRREIGTPERSRA
jgi:hypothetical protein